MFCRVLEKRLRVLKAVTRRCSVKKVFLEISQNSKENTCARVFINKETRVQVFPCEFCEISNNIFFTEHPWASASVQFEE